MSHASYCMHAGILPSCEGSPPTMPAVERAGTVLARRCHLPGAMRLCCDWLEVRSGLADAVSLGFALSNSSSRASNFGRDMASKCEASASDTVLRRPPGNLLVVIDCVLPSTKGPPEVELACGVTGMDAVCRDFPLYFPRLNKGGSEVFKPLCRQYGGELLEVCSDSVVSANDMSQASDMVSPR